MTKAESGVYILLGGGELLLEVASPTAVDARALPERVRMYLHCAACNASCEAAADVTFAYIDDDHFGYTDLAYDARLACACPRCNTALATAVRLTITRYPDGSAQLLCQHARR